MPFNFNAHTVAIGGQIEENDTRRPLPSEASVTLAPDGGFGESCVSNYREEGISIYRAESRVYGTSYKDRFAGKTKLFKTFASVTVYGLDLNGIRGQIELARFEKQFAGENPVYRYYFREYFSKPNIERTYNALKAKTGQK